MTLTQRRLLRSLIWRLTRIDEADAWYNLKREMFDSGYQSEYEWELEFFVPAERALGRLFASEKAALVAEWRKVEKDTTRSDETILGLYVPMILREIRNRAWAGAFRTNW